MPEQVDEVELGNIDKLGVDVNKLVDLYKACAPIIGEKNASTIVAEAIASESTSVQYRSAEATSSIAAEAVVRLAKSARPGA